MGSPQDAPRVLITRLSAIGDCILTLPLACALRDHFPGAYLAWVVEPAAGRLLAGHSAVDEFIVAPKGWLKSYRQVRGLRQQLRARKFDYALDPQSLTKSALLGWFSGAPHRIGFAAPRGRELAPWLHTRGLDVGESHLVDATLQLLEPLGVPHPRVRFDLPISTEAEAVIDRFLVATELTGGFVVVNCGASCPARLWPESRFAQVIRHIAHTFDLPSVVTWAGRAESARADRIVELAGERALRAPDTSLAELAALQRRARLMIGSDTGPLHLAVAVGTTCLGLYGATRPGRSGPYGTRHRVVESSVPLNARGRRRRTDDSAMRRISAEAVCRACDRLLAAEAAPGGLDSRVA